MNLRFRLYGNIMFDTTLHSATESTHDRLKIKFKNVKCDHIKITISMKPNYNENTA